MKRSLLPLLLAVLAGCSKTEAPAEKKFDPFALTERAPDVYRVKMDTSRGEIVIEVTRGMAPNGADRFYNLVKSGFYDGARFFRVIYGFVAQFGLSGRPEFDQAWQQATIPDDPPKESNRRGTITFAKAGPNSRTTQVFVNLRDNQQLDPQGFAPFGRVTVGMGVIDALYKGYGDASPAGIGPDQAKIRSLGNEWLQRQFPRLDVIKTAKIE